MRIPALSCLLVVVLTLAACGGGGGDPKSTVAVIGDMPYGASPTDTSQFIANSAFIDAINLDTDGGTSPLAVHSQAQEFDAGFPGDKAYVENVWYEQSGVLFVTLNVPGGSNNDTDTWYGAPAMGAVQSQEVANRSEAVKRWLDTAFKRATSNGDRAVVIQLQADMWDVDGAAATHLSQYKQFIDSIASNAKAFGKPVLLFNGDSHIYRSDNPLAPGAPCVIEPSPGAAAVACSNATVPSTYGNADPYLNQPYGYNVPNFHRVTVHGSTTPLEWLKLTIDPEANPAVGAVDAFGPFSWKRIRP